MNTLTNELQLSDVTITSKKQIDDIYHYHISPKTEPNVCPFCRSTHLSKNGSTKRVLKDSPIYDHPVVLHVNFNRYICSKCGKTFTAPLSFAGGRDKITYRLYKQIQNRCLIDSNTRLARDFNVSGATINRITAEYIADKERQWTKYTPKVLGLSEMKIRKNTYILCIDIERNGVVDILEKSHKEELISELKARFDPSEIKTAIIGLNRVHRDALRAFCNYLQITISKPYVLSRVIDATRAELKGGDGKTTLLVLKNPENLTKDENAKLTEAFRNGRHLEKIYKIKNLFYDMYKANTPDRAEDIFEQKICEIVSRKNEPYLYDTAVMINDFYEEVFNFFEHCYSTKAIENAEKLIRRIERNSNGVAFKTLRARLLFGQKSSRATKEYYTIGHISGVGFMHPNRSYEEFIGNYVDLDMLLAERNLC